MVGAERGVLFDAAAELAEAECENSVGETGGLQIVEEGLHRAGKFAQQTRVGWKLGGVRVVAGLDGIVDRRGEFGFDELRDGLEATGQLGLRIRRGVAGGALRNFVDKVSGCPRVESSTAGKGEKIVFTVVYWRAEKLRAGF